MPPDAENVTKPLPAPMPGPKGRVQCTLGQDDAPAMRCVLVADNGTVMSMSLSGRGSAGGFTLTSGVRMSVVGLSEGPASQAVLLRDIYMPYVDDIADNPPRMTLTLPVRESCRVRLRVPPPGVSRLAALPVDHFLR